MADGQVEIEVTAKTELGEVEELNDLVERIKETAGEETTINLYMDDLKSELEEATSDVERLQEQLLDMEVGDPDFDSIVTQLEEAEGRAEDLSSQLEAINDIVVAPQVDTSDLDKANEKVEETEDSLANVKTAIVGLVATAEIEHMATVADNINTSWNRLSLTFENTGVTIDMIKDKVSQVSSETSRSGGMIRDYFNQMGVAGVTNLDLLASSFESISGKAYQLDTSIESLESKMQTMVLTGNVSAKMLKGLGLTAEDLAAVLNVTADEVKDAFADLTPEQRLQAITLAMGDGAAANEMYGDSYEAMKAKADMAMSGLEGAVGQAILPTVIPVLDTTTNMVKGLTDAFKSLPAPVQGAIGTVMGVSAVATTAVGTIGEVAGSIANISDAYGALKGVYEALIPVQEAEGVAGWLSIGWIAVAIAAGILLGLALIYLYENCDWFREGIDYLVNSLSNLVNYISSAVLGVINWLSTSFTDFTNQLGLNTQNWIEAVLGFLLFIPQLPMRLAVALTNALASTLGFGNNFVQTIINSAANAVNGFINYIRQLPNALMGELQRMIQMALDFATHFPSIIWNAAVKAVTSFGSGSGIHSPGYMYYMLKGEMGLLEDLPKNSKLPSNIEGMASKMVSGFNGGLGTDGLLNNSFGSSNSGVLASNETVINIYGDVDSDDRVRQIVDAVRRELNWDNVTAGRTIDTIRG